MTIDWICLKCGECHSAYREDEQDKCHRCGWDRPPDNYERMKKGI